MRFLSQDPDIETIVRRIEDGDYDLQPDFQRGEVWTLQKKRRLVDSILRGWHVPPVHLVVGEDGRSDVLDGQQRLTAIRDFVRGHFAVDGKLEPLDPRIQELNGLRYAQLPGTVARQFRKFTIRVFELVDYSPDEPHELFFRLNQPTSLTEAEKRNAFVGDARNQVRELVDWATRAGLLTDRVGFSNARMAYDDMLARVLVTIEARSLEAKVTASLVTARYRVGKPFADEDVDVLRESLRVVLSALNPDVASDKILRPNKATLHTWLCFGAQMALVGRANEYERGLAETIRDLESARWQRSSGERTGDQRTIALFQDRSTARVADVSSVVLRDLIAWMFLARSSAATGPASKLSLAQRAWRLVNDEGDTEDTLLAFANESNWGDLGWG
ncbi:DUF262 domain-containing protein [Agromyces sp. NPDC060279]|uniref:DUF262 domain-containing protein n=1 Tax=Agromyces sp. NPDC060279 TaxID=3347092 RepID=UPI003663423A